MEAKGFKSKPLALVVIGLVIGASLGIGSGYAILFPQMVRERTQTTEERMDVLEEEVQGVNTRLDQLNGSLSAIGGGIEDIANIAESLSLLNTRLNNQEQDITDLEEEFEVINENLDEIRAQFLNLQDLWEETDDEFSDLKKSFDSFDNQIRELEDEIRLSTSIGQFKTYIANPLESDLSKLTDKIYTELLDDEDFNDWADNIGTSAAKNLLEKELTKMKGGLVWNYVESKPLGLDFQVTMECYTSLEFSPASVSIDQMRVKVTGNVDPDTGNVIQFKVDVIEII